ncbi:hypothetical protein S245_008956, partial [Arachis hypogaea]
AFFMLEMTPYLNLLVYMAGYVTSFPFLVFLLLKLCDKTKLLIVLIICCFSHLSGELLFIQA